MVAMPGSRMSCWLLVGAGRWVRRRDAGELPTLGALCALLLLRLRFVGVGDLSRACATAGGLGLTRRASSEDTKSTITLVCIAKCSWGET